LRIDSLQEELVENPLDQVLLGWEIAVEQRLRDAEPMRQLARLPGEAEFGKEAYRLGDDLLLADCCRKSLVGLERAQRSPLGGSYRRPPSGMIGRSR
jgi:hypothetical protein